MMSLLDNSSLRLLQSSLDAASLRQRVIANNIANVDTPFFKRSEVRFEDLLQQQMDGAPSIEAKRTDARHFYFGNSAQNVVPEIVEDNSSVMNNNMNNVDIDSEMSLMAKNQLRYDIAVQQTNNQLKMLRTAIDGGK